MTKKKVLKPNQFLIHEQCLASYGISLIPTVIGFGDVGDLRCIGSGFSGAKSEGNSAVGAGFAGTRCKTS